jgi:hypothetical protein
MPNGILTDLGAATPLKFWLSQSIAGVIDWQLRLFKNDYVPVDGTLLSNLTEPTFGGYTRVTLTRSMWTSPVVTAGCAVSTWGTDPYIWYVTASPLDTIYGWCMVDTVAGELRWVQRFDDADIAPLELGARFLLLPTITMTSAACAGDTLKLGVRRTPKKVKV